MQITHNTKEYEFGVEVDGQKAHVKYTISDNKLDILHTLVPEALKGQGLASLLVQSTYDYAIENGLKPVATCPYAVVWLKRHPEYTQV